MNPTRKQFSRIVILLALALCLMCLGVMIVPFKSAIMEVHEREATRYSRPGESPAVHALVEPHQGAAQQVERARLAGSASSQVYLDPVTGKIGPPPQEAKSLPRLLSPEEENARSSSSEGLVETPVLGPAGGVKIDLQGRFRSEAVASIDTQSNLSIQCAPSGVSENKGTQREK